jgi:prephenate dehydrogenase
MPDRSKASVLGAGPAGIALASALSSRFGPVDIWEPNPDIGRPARGARGVAGVSADLPATVRGAAIVACAVVRGDLCATLEAVGPHLSHGAIVLVDTIGHEAAHADAERLLPPHASVACFTVFPPPPDEARPNARTQSQRAPATTAGISPAPSAHPDAVGVVQAIVEGMGAETFFGEAREIDGFAAASLVIPAVVGAAAVRGAISARSSRDLDRAGGSPLAALTAALELAPPSPEEIIAVGEHVARLIRTIANDLEAVAATIDGTKAGATAEACASIGGIADAAERRRTWLAARASSAAVSEIDDLPKPSRRRLFF